MVSLEGCGGGSNSFSYNNNNNNNNDPDTGSVEEDLRAFLVNSDMVSVMHGNEWLDLINEFDETGSGDKMNPQSWVYCIADEEEERLSGKYADDESSLEMLEALLFDADRISRDYADENIILLIYPDEDYINRTLKAIGLEGNYVLNSAEAPSGRLELFAIAKRTVNERIHTFTYYAACDDAFTISDDLSAPSTEGGRTDVIVSGDIAYVVDENGNIISSSDVVNDNPEETASDDTESIEQFTLARWRTFYDWAASLTEWAIEQSAEASSIEIRSAADENDLTKISTAQTGTLDCSIYKNGYQPWGNINGTDAVNVRRANTASFIIYSCHSFTSGSDYYLVKATARTATHYYQDRDALTFRWEDDSFNKEDIFFANMSGHKDPVNYISGFTKTMTIYASLKNGNPGMLANTPTNVAKETNYSNTMGWNIGGSVVGGAPAMSNISLNLGASFSETKSFTKKAYEITNALDMFNPSWVLSYTDGIRDGHWHANGSYGGINPPPQSTENVEFEASWIWEVNKSVWGNAGKTLTMNLEFRSQDGFAFGRGESYFPLYAWQNQEKYPYFISKKEVIVNAPTHFWLSNRTHPFSKEKGSATFEVLAKYDWKMSTDATWLHLLSPGGKATGADKYRFMLEVDTNNTGSMRTGNITFEMTYNGHTESKTIQVVQSSI